MEPVISWDNILHNATPQTAERVFSLKCWGMVSHLVKGG
jgi:hypothetical protein